LSEIRNIEGSKYADLCAAELSYLNKNVKKIQSKMMSCIYGVESPYMKFRINYNLAIQNVKRYNDELLNVESQTHKNEQEIK
jgi:hypothetical protein